MAGQATRKIVPRATGRVCVDVLVQQRQVKRNADNNQDQARGNQQNNRFQKQSHQQQFGVIP